MGVSIADVKIELISGAELFSAFEALCALLNPVQSHYPDFYSWIWGVFRSGISSERRVAFVATIDGEIVGVSLLKNEAFERKVCTLFVDSLFRGVGIGEALFERSVRYLAAPVSLSVNVSVFPMMRKILQVHAFTETCRVGSEIYFDNKQAHS